MNLWTAMSGPLSRAVGVEEPQRGDVESVQQVERPPHRLGRLLRRGVGRHAPAPGGSVSRNGASPRAP